MPLAKLQIQPGINKEGTQYSAGPTWYDCDKIRFRKGRAEKIGGWDLRDISVTFNGENTATFRGVPRSIFDWGTRAAKVYIGIGTNLKYYVDDGGSFEDITPIRETTAAGDATFSADHAGQTSTITVSETGHGAVAGDYVSFSGAASLGGNITSDVLNHEYEIDTVTSGDAYTIIARDTSNQIVTANGSDTGNGGASAVAAYQINTGTNSFFATTGFGVGTFGYSVYSGSGSLSFSNSLRLWSQSDFGDDLIINPRGGPIYYWDEDGVSSPNRAIALSALPSASDTPVFCRQVIASPIDRHVIAFGVNPLGSGTIDPLLIRWSSQEDAGDWTPTPTNTAGGQVLSNGTEIIGAVRTRQEIMVFTDTSIHSMRYAGAPFVFTFTPVAENIAMVSPRAAVSAGDAVYFMGREGFYVYQGSVRKIPCTVLDYVYTNINISQLYKVFAAYSSDNNEVTWFYPTGDPTTITEVTRYVTFNFQEQVWTIGTMERGCWNQALTAGNPLAGSNNVSDIYSNVIYRHEQGHDDAGSPMNAYIESGAFEISDGDSFMFLKRFIPDFRYKDGTGTNFANLTFELSRADYPQITPASEVSVTVTDTTRQKHVRFRGREMTLKITDNGSGYGWVLGDLRFDMRTDGKRGGGAYK